MNLWFDRNNQEKILLKYLPTGKAYKQAFVEGSNFNKIIKWISFNFQWLVDRYNRTFKALYVCEGDYLVEKWKTDYNIPNNVFYLSEKENRTDVFVLRYLMKGNTKWHFQAIANIYDGRCNHKLMVKASFKGLGFLIEFLINYMEELKMLLT